MGDFFATLFIDIIIGYILSAPGAFVIWLIEGRKRTYKEVWKSDVYWNSMVGGLILGLTSMVLYFSFFK